MRRGLWKSARIAGSLRSSGKPAAVRILPKGAMARRGGAVVALGLLLGIASPAEIGQQDVAALLLSALDGPGRWAVSLGAGPGGETKLVTTPLGEAGGSASVRVGDGAVVLQGIGPEVAGAADPTLLIPDEERIERSWKGDLPMTLTTPATAPGFSAGSVFREQSRLTPPPSAVDVASAFTRTEAPLSMLAIGRFIEPRPAHVDVAELEPIPLPTRRPNATSLVAANYPVRSFAPDAANEAAEAMLAAYAPDASVVGQDMFDALFQTPRERPPAPVVAVNPGDHWWAALPLPSSVYSAKEQRCLAEAIYFEARGEPYDGQVAVAQVVLNRVRNPAYPDTTCDVVYQNENVRNACQFSFACDGIKDVVHPGAAWNRAVQVATDVSTGGVSLAEIGTATHYHATYVRPNWAGVFKKKAKIGRHVFYQTIYGGWS